MYRRVRGLTNNASLAGMLPIAHMSEALEALLKELHEKPKNINASTLRTVAAAIDFLALLFERRDAAPSERAIEANVMVVDDEAISRRALVYALEKAKLKVRQRGRSPGGLPDALAGLLQFDFPGCRHAEHERL